MRKKINDSKKREQGSIISEKEVKRKKKEARKLKRQKRKIKRISYKYVRYLIIIVAISVIGYFLFKISHIKRYPNVGDHWHAQYEVFICGTRMPSLPYYTQGNIHTHGDGLIHIHPQNESEAGKNATLERFFENAGGVFKQNILQYPGSKVYRNSDICSNSQPGFLKLLVNGKENKELDQYVPDDGDKIRIEFSTN